MTRVAVVGGGISGLSAALALQDAGIEVALIESRDRLGGSLHTERLDGYVVDAGPDSFLSIKPGALQIAARLGIEDKVINTRPDGGGTYILHRGNLEPLPEGITMLVPTQIRQIVESPLIDLRGKLRLAAEYFIPARRGDADEALADFMIRRVGRQTFENLAEPLLSGIYAGDATKLSLLSTMPRLREAELRHGGLIRSALAQRRAARGGQPERRYTPFAGFDGGLGTLVDAAAGALERADIRLGSAVSSLESQQPSGYRLELESGDSVEADGVILATPAYVSARLLEPFQSVVAGELWGIPYVSTATVSMGFREVDIAGKQVGRGFVVPRAEGIDLTAVTWSSNKFAGRAPEGEALLRGFVGRGGNQEPAYLPDDQVVDLVRANLAAITGVTADPLFARVYRWHDAMPQYHVGHREKLERIDRLMTSFPTIALTGNAYRGVGIPDCIVNARSAALELAARLGALPRAD